MPILSSVKVFALELTCPPLSSFFSLVLTARKACLTSFIREDLAWILDSAGGALLSLCLFAATRLLGDLRYDTGVVTLSSPKVGQPTPVRRPDCKGLR